MVKVLIAEDNETICIHLSNKISSTKEVQAIQIVNKGNEVMEKIKDFKPEIIVLDLKLPGEDGISILNKIQNDSSIDTNVIIYSGEPTYINRIRGYDCVRAFYNKLTPHENIGVEIQRIAREIDGEVMKKKIYDIIYKIGFAPSHKGTDFLEECVEIAIRENEENLNVMYDKVAKGKKQTCHTVKADVQRAIKKMWRYADKEKVRRIFRLGETEDPSPKNVVPMIKYYVNK